MKFYAMNGVYYAIKVAEKIASNWHLCFFNNIFKSLLMQISWQP